MVSKPLPILFSSDDNLLIYNYILFSATFVKDENGKEKQKPKIKEKTIVKKHIQPDTAAIIFTLTNGNPDRWKNRQDSNISGLTPVSKFEGMTDEQLEDFIYGEKQKRDIVVDGRGGGCAETPESEK